MHVDLYWLDVPERLKYKFVTMVYNCLHGKAPSYLTDCCTPISDVVLRRHLRSASRRQLLVPRHSLNLTRQHNIGYKNRRPYNLYCVGADVKPCSINQSTYGRRTFSVAGPAAWNCLYDELREPLLTVNSFRQLLKTRLFAEY